MKSSVILFAGLAAVTFMLGGCLFTAENNSSAVGMATGGLFNYTTVTTLYTVITIPTATSTPSAGSAVSYVTYENPIYKIKMQYPSYLTKQESSGDVVFFLSSQNSTNDAFPANVNILVQNISDQPMSLDDFTNQSIEQIKELVPDYAFTDSRKATLAKEDGYLLAYTGTQDLLKLKWMSVYTIKNNTLYLITYTAGVDKFSIYLSAVSKMLDSFEITG